MNEVKKPQKPLIFYYVIVLGIMFLLNLLIVPTMQQMKIQEVDYGTFMRMTENSEIGKVKVEDNQILFTDKEEKNIYKTGLMNDPALVERLYKSNAQFSSEIIEQMSPLANFLLTWVLPIVIFAALGQFLSKQMMKRMTGGDSSMMFNIGKSNAKVYVKSSGGIKFDDVAGEDEAKENLAEIVSYLHDP